MPYSVNNPALNAIQQIPVYDIEVDGELINLSTSEIKQVRLQNSEGKHEAAAITTQLTKSQIDQFVGKPITFKYGSRVNVNTFYGYVITINPNQNYKQDALVDIACLGTTWTMQAGRPRTFTDTTVSSAFSSIVLPHKLGVQTDDHQYRWPSLAQTDESDWSYLQSLAHKVGYCVYVHKGIVRLVDPDRIIRDTGAFQHYVRSDDILDPSRQLIDFKPTTQSLRIRDNMKPVYGYFENGEPQVLGSLDVYPHRMTTDTPVKNYEMANVYSGAWDRRVDFWNHQATARISGNANIIPGINISIQLGNGFAGKNEHDGVWLVRGVEHSLTNNSFQTTLDLARDRINTRSTNVNFSWFFANNVQGSPKLNIVEINDLKRWKSNWSSPELVTQTLAEKVVPINPITLPEDFVGIPPGPGFN
jgi:hypothetical protein